MPDWRIALVQNNISFRRHQRLFHRIVDDIEFIPPSINDMEVHILRTISVSIIYVQPRITPCIHVNATVCGAHIPEIHMVIIRVTITIAICI